MKLRQKFFLIFVLISVIPVLAVSLYTYSRYTRLIDQQISMSTEHLMNTASGSIEQTLQNIEHITEAMYLPRTGHEAIVDLLHKYAEGTSPDSWELYQDNEKLGYACQDFINFYSYINGIFIFTPSGKTLGYAYGSNINVWKDYPAADADWYQATLDLGGGVYLYGQEEKPFFQHAADSISFCTALSDVNTREFLGVLMVDCNPEVFDLTSVNTMPELAVFTVEKEDQLLYKTGITSADPENSTNPLVLSRTFSIPGLNLIAVVEREGLYEDFRFTQIALISVGILCILIFVIVSVILSRNLTKPIEVLSDTMARPGDNPDVSDSPYFRYNNEIGTLYNSFQEMVDERNSYIKNELENKLILMDSQMKSLESQINAHFLYNTLESINSIASLRHVPEISTMSMALGSMFRYSIKTKSELVTLAEELEHVNNYLAIQKIRFDDGFTCRIEIPDNLMQMRVLKLILQPIVENALYHGLGYCRDGDEIVITGAAKEQNLVITVRDNGRGMSKEQLTRLTQQLEEKPEFQSLGHRTERSIGIRNIHTRIALYYGELYGLRIFSQDGEGTSVEIIVPIVTG